MKAWQLLIHVCRRWRSLVLGSPLHLNLRLVCAPETPASDILDVWPALPLIVEGNITSSDIIPALGQRNRVCEVYLQLRGWEPWDEGWRLEKVLASMQVPFPELRVLQLSSLVLPETPIVPDSFLGGSAPRLQGFHFVGIPFPGLPKLLLSTTHLVCLWLSDIPHSGYISPEAMAAPISVLSSLRTLSIRFRSPQFRPDRESRSQLPPKRSILSALHEFYFTGVTEYLEEFLTRIDTPQLNIMDITFLNQINFDCPRLAQFINCTPKLRVLDEAHVRLTSVELRTSEPSFYNLLIHILLKERHWQLSSIEQICNSSLHPLSTVEDLYIKDENWPRVRKKDGIENTLWLQLLLPYTAVKNLYLSMKFAPSIAAALQELVGARITEVLPSLQNIFIEVPRPLGGVGGPFQFPRFPGNIWAVHYRATTFRSPCHHVWKRVSESAAERSGTVLSYSSPTHTWMMELNLKSKWLIGRFYVRSLELP
jgi:hypothetical protein